ncbi:hypothetical protein [Caballeronia sp. KNU42]
MIAVQNRAATPRVVMRRKRPQSQPGWIDTYPAKQIEEPQFAPFFLPHSTLSTFIATLSNKKFS